MTSGYPTQGLAGEAAMTWPAPVPGEWTPRKYLMALVALAVPAAIIVTIGFLAGEPWLGGIVAAVPFAILILIRPEFGLYLFVLYAPFENFALIGETSVPKILGIYTFAAALIHSLRGGLLPLRVAAFWLVLGFAVWSGLTIFVADNPDLAVQGWFTRIQMVGLIFTILCTCTTRQKADTLAWAMFLTPMIVSVAGFFLAPYGEKPWEVRRLTVSGGNLNIGANSFAKAIMPGIFLAPYIITKFRSRWRWLALGGMVLVLVAMVASGSRSNYAAAILGVIAMVLLYRPIPFGRRTLLAIAALVGIVGFVAAGAALGIWERGLWTRIIEITTRGLEEGGRKTLWLSALELGADHPLTGIGIGNFIVTMVRVIGRIKAAHNDFLTHFAETGLPGLLLYCGFLAAVFRSAMKTAEPWLRAGLGGLMIAAIIGSMANPSYGEKCFWLQLGACLLGSMAFGPAAASGEQPLAPGGPATAAEVRGPGTTA